MRINNSIRNIRIGIMSQLIITCLGFFSRKIFLDNFLPVSTRFYCANEKNMVNFRLYMDMFYSNVLKYEGLL